MQGSPDSGIWKIFVCEIGNPGKFTCGIQNPERSWGAFLWDDPHQDHWLEITRIMADQMNRRILVQSGFIGSFDLPWSEWSRITDPDPNHPKGPHPWIPKTVLYSGFHAVDSEFQALDSGFFVSGRDSGVQSLGGFLIPWSVFRIPKRRISDSSRKICRTPQEKFSGIRNSDSLTRGQPKVSMATNDNTGL